MECGGDFLGVLCVDGVDGFDPECLRPVDEHSEGSSRDVARNGEVGHGLQGLSCW